MDVHYDHFKQYFSHVILPNFEIKMSILRMFHYLIPMLSFCVWVVVFSFLGTKLKKRSSNYTLSLRNDLSKSTRVFGCFFFLLAYSVQVVADLVSVMFRPKDKLPASDQSQQSSLDLLCQYMASCSDACLLMELWHLF